MITEMLGNILRIDGIGKYGAETLAQKEYLYLKTIKLIRLRLHEGYFLSIYDALGNLVPVLAERYPEIAAEYIEVIHRLVSSEEEVFNKVMTKAKINISEPVSEEEKEVVDILLSPENMDKAGKKILLRYFLPERKSGN
jgi:hypothetical protein